MSSSGPQVNTWLRATAPTVISDARLLRVASAMYMSRSVTTPTGEPRYGAMRPTSDQPADAQPDAQPAPGAQQPDQPERPA